MKFKHVFDDAMLKEGFPPHWIQSAIPYGQLKKVIKKVKKELEGILEELGLDSADLVSAQNDEGREDGSVAFQYRFHGDETLRPKLTLTFDGDSPVDASLSPDTKDYLKTVLRSRRRSSQQTSQPEGELQSVLDPVSASPSTSRQVRTEERKRDSIKSETTAKSGKESIRRVEVPLTFDAEFFELLQGDVTTLDVLQAKEQEVLTQEIAELSKDMTRLAAPSRFTKTDMYRWRALFDIYLQASVFFSTKEMDHGSRNSTVAAEQLNWFQSEVTRQGIVETFKLPASHRALNRFIAVNIELLQNLKFQEMNQKAIGKILKKFDKRTQLGAVNSFPKLIQADPIMTETMAKAVCAQVTHDIVQITPQIDDAEYSCPVCFTIAWRPVRLSCQHMICSKCAVEFQRTRKYRCPMCRSPVIKNATEENIDDELVKKLKKYFPKESREKQIELETEDGIATFGETYKHPSERSCRMM